MESFSYSSWDLAGTFTGLGPAQVGWVMLLKNATLSTIFSLVWKECVKYDPNPVNTNQEQNECRLTDLSDHGDERKDEEGKVKYF